MKKSQINKLAVLIFSILFLCIAILPSINGYEDTIKNRSDYFYKLNDQQVEHSIASVIDGMKIKDFQKNTLVIDDLFKGNQHDIYDRPWFNVSDIKDFGQAAFGCTTNDFNNDNYLDFAVSYATSPFMYATISIFYNDGNLNFIQEDVFTFNKYIKDLDSGDYDNDGDVDFIFTYCEQSGQYNVYGITSLLYNNGQNNFGNESIIAYRGSGVPGDPEGRINPQVTSADYDRDEDIDLLVGDNSGKVEFYMNNGAGNFTSAGIIHDFGFISWGLTSADVDGDNNIDFFVTALDSETEMRGHVYLKRNNGLPSCFDIGEGEEILNYSGFGVSIQVLDFDNDGNIDFLLGNSNKLYLFYNKEGSYIQLYLGRLPDSEEGYVDHLRLGGMTVGDYNNDSHIDIVTGGVQGIVRLFIRNSGPWVFITKPKDGYYYHFDQEYRESSLVFPGVVGKITIETLVSPEVQKVAFYIDNKLRNIDLKPPFSWTWRIGRPMLWHDGDMKIKAVGYTSTNNGCEVEIQIEKTPIWLHFLLQFLESWLI